ncbi:MULTISPECIES: Stp1/IreP family PP2C-type Ser/Thr phosphatase [unclassified Paenibacillus]|uniref:Stp1/IreP family PP2C-type Ser/Thr phosphatase n=1 Tax=unclassified Paenibacillus TaxID=185978 RepID=UPI001051CC46|nr:MULTISPECIES: Stp1/IreP family PP2C-type Ser/Thr phosphatase [unclassified Paenibacillus]NIK68585.1 protein phosphatase [Paenibacillus sp. BK720]TCM99127.1 protein phosphatase [Paenibacillus sp. BK033]
MITANRSDVGRIRHINEDRSWVGQLDNGITLAIVADGMGGHQAGDVASQLAVNTFRDMLEKSASKADLSMQEGKMLIRQALVMANDVVYDMASRNEQYYNMGTTIVAALYKEQQLIIGHIGDSRAYLITADGIAQLTEDHTLVNELVKSGQISLDEAAHHPRRNVITRAVGTDAQVEVDIYTAVLSDNDVLLLCSDGLTNMVSDEEMLQTVREEGLGLDDKADRLIQLALQAGGDDNVTVVLLQEESAAYRGGDNG